MPAKLVKDAPAPGTPEWRKQITASKIPAILGLSPYQTAGELWMQMSGLVDPEPIGDTQRRIFDMGHFMEDAIAKAWKAENEGWQTSPGEVAFTNTDIGFPNLATIDRRAVNRKVGAGQPGRYRVLEIKISASQSKWGTPTDDLPADVAAQTIFQMGVSGIHQATVGALVGYDKPLIPRFYTLEFDPDIFAGIVETAHAFYESLGESVPPAPTPELLHAIAGERQQRAETGKWDADDCPQISELAALDNDIMRLTAQRDQLQQTIIDEAAGRAIYWQGKKISRKTAGRFSQSRIPAEAKHLAKDPDVLTTKTAFDSKKFAEKYPDVYAASISDDTITIKELS